MKNSQNKTRPFYSPQLYFILIIFFIFIFLFSFSCQQSEQVIRTVEDGIEIIQYNNPEKWIPRFTLKLEEELVIAGYYEDVYVPFGKLTDVMVNQNGEIFIVEQNTSKVYKFSKQGEFIKTFGRTGKGPGESIDPGSMFLYENNYCYLAQTPQKVIFFDQDLNYVDDLTLRPRTAAWIYRDQNNSPLFFYTMDSVVPENGNVLDRYFLSSWHTFNYPNFKRDTLSEYRSRNPGERQGNKYIMDYEAPAVSRFAPDSTFWINKSIEYKIELKNRFKGQRIIKIDYPLEKLTD